MKTEARIKQSRVRVRSGIRMAGFFLSVVVSAFIFNVLWLVKRRGESAVS